MFNRIQIIAKFYVDFKEYLIILINNSKIYFANFDKSKYNFELNSQELKLMFKIYNSLMINKENTIFIKTIQLNDRKYEIFLDTNSKNYFWKNENYRDYYKDNIELNFLFNNDSIYLNTGKYVAGDENRNFYNRIIKVGVKFIRIFVSAGIVLSILPNYSNVNIIEHDQELLDPEILRHNVEELIKNDEDYFEGIKTDDKVIELFEKNRKQEYNFEEIKECIENNQNIDNKTKEFLYKLKFVFDEYHQYMDLDLIKNRLKDLKIVFTEKSCKENSAIKGTYDITDNSITIYEKKEFQINNFEDANTFLHEIFHVLQNYSKNYLLEFSDELFSREIARKMVKLGLLEDKIFYVCNNYIWGTGYDDSIFIYRYLAEIIPKKDVIKYQFQSDEEKSFVRNLISIDQSNYSSNDIEAKNRAWRFIDEFNQFKNIGYGNLDLRQKLLRKLIKDLNYYYYPIKGYYVGDESNLDSVTIKSSDFFYCCNGMEDNDIIKSIGKALILRTGKTDNSNNKHNFQIQREYILDKTYFSDDQKNVKMKIKIIDMEKDNLGKYTEYEVDLDDEFKEIYKMVYLKDQVKEER